MGNPFLTTSPFTPGMPPPPGIGFPGIPGVGIIGPGITPPPVGGGVNPIGIEIPGVGQVGVCPPGTHCVGPSMDVLGIKACFGSCKVTANGGAQPPVIVVPPPGIGMPPTPGMPPGGGGIIVGMPRKRKRMNYSNQKALRRALRRASGYARQQKSIRKAAGEFAREFGPKTRRARRDAPPGHGHVR